LSNAIGGSVPDHSSRTSVEHHSQSQSDELSCANSAVSVDFPEQLASTIGEYFFFGNFNQKKLNK
jgi:hypothetical protein